MCGIGGVKRFGDEPISKYQIESLLLDNERRGNDATGIALQNDGDDEIYIWKSSKPASTAISEEEYKKFMEEKFSPATRVVICHTRAATSSDYRVLENNHPMFAGDCAVVHNGVIHNHEYIFRQLKTQEPNCPTDSDVLRGVLDEYGMTDEGIKQLARISGSVAMAAISVDKPGYLLLVKSGGPLHIGLTEQQLIFASQKEFVYNAARPYVKRFGIYARPTKAEVAFTPMPNDTGWLIGPKELEIHRECRICGYEKSEPDRSRYNSEFNKRRMKGGVVVEGVEDLLPEYIKCPNDKCGKPLHLVGDMRTRHLGDLYCPKCNVYLDGKGKRIEPKGLLVN